MKNKLRIEDFRNYSLKYDQRVKGKEDQKVETELREWFKDHKYLDKPHFLLLGRWKTPRQINNYIKNSDELIKEVTTTSFNSSNEELRIKSLFILNGVSWPVASTILHFAFPDRYSIMDFRAIWTLGIKQPSSYNFEFWCEYCKRINDITNKTGLSIRTIDKALWEYSKENQR